MRLGDPSTPDACGAPPTTLITGSGDVMINGVPATKVGDSYSPHPCPGTPPHSVTVVMGSATVMINKMPAHRVGDLTNCAATGAMGSTDVLIGG